MGADAASTAGADEPEDHPNVIRAALADAGSEVLWALSTPGNGWRDHVVTALQLLVVAYGIDSDGKGLEGAAAQRRSHPSQSE